MAKLEYRLLSDSELSEGLAGLDGWSVEDGKLSKQFTFNSYQEGLMFALGVGMVAEKMDHHPDMEVGYSKVKISVNTHSVGGLSPYDLELARRIGELQSANH